MLVANYNHIAAPIEAPELIDFEARIEFAAQILIDQRMADKWVVSEAVGFVDAREWNEIEIAVLQHDDLKAGRMLREAIARVIREQANKDAARTWRKVLRDHLDD